MFRSLSGYRTYIIGWLWLALAFVAASQGWVDSATAAGWAFQALGLLGLRAGVSNLTESEDESNLAQAIGDLLDHASAPRSAHLADAERHRLAAQVWDLARTYGDRPARSLPQMTGAEVVDMVGYEIASKAGGTD